MSSDPAEPVIEQLNYTRHRLRWFDTQDHPLREEIYEVGQLRERNTLNATGHKHGRCETFELGNLRLVATFHHGLEHGETLQYSRLGELLGSYKLFFGTGVIRLRAERGHFTLERAVTKGLYHGWSTHWDASTGALVERTHWHQGVRDGPSWDWAHGEVFYYLQGALVPAHMYERERPFDALRAIPYQPLS